MVQLTIPHVRETFLDKDIIFSFTPAVPNSNRALTLLTVKLLSVRPDFCYQLLSDSDSQWTPLPLAVRFLLLGLTQGLHPLDNTHVEHTKKTPPEGKPTGSG